MSAKSLRASIGLGLLLALTLLLACSDSAPVTSASTSETNTSTTLAATPATSSTYTEAIQPIFDNRCIACHGCLGSPCNLKLSSFRGVDRGGFGDNPYSTHFEAYQPTGMDVVSTTQEWRERGFYPVVSRAGSADQNLAGSMLYQIVTAGHQYNQPGFSRQALMSSYKDRYEHSCPDTPKALAANLTSNPSQGMPYGLPSLGSSNVQSIKNWIEDGSPGPTAEELSAADQVNNPKSVAEWEAFFNGNDAKQKLVSRYIFDHVYLSSLALDESPGDTFKLVRSKTMGNSPADAARGVVTPAIEIIDTPHPYTNPLIYAGVDEFYYRLKKITYRPVQKNHFIWNLDESDIGHLKTLFLAPDWDPQANLDAPWDIGNPFLMYQAIPTRSRYRFLLENSSVIVGGITSGPVCLGQAATYAVKDHFWVYFIDPESDVSVLNPQLGMENWAALMDRSPLGNAAYEDAYGKSLKKFFPDGYSIDAVWDGDRTNPNAWLTILRHESNTWVLTGRQGGIPRSQWLMGYSGFERIYYDTVAHFEYFGGDIGKLETLGFFNFLRQEFEDNFLLLLPEDMRTAIRKRWTKGIGEIGLYFSPFPGKDLPSAIKNEDPKNPLLGIVKDLEAHLGETVSGPPDLFNPWIKPDYPLEDGIASYDDWMKAISTMTVTTKFKLPQFIPSMVIIKLNHKEESRLYTLVVNRVYQTQYTLLFQNGEQLPDLYTLSVYPTIVGGFPNLFMEFDLSQASAFIQEMRNVESLDDYLDFRDRYAVLRNQENFWKTYDWFNAWNFEHRREEAGVFDLSYYDLFDSVY